MDTNVRSVSRWTYPLALMIGVAWSLFFALDQRFFPRQGMQDWIERWRVGRLFLDPESSAVAMTLVAMVFSVWAPVSTVDAWRKLGWQQFWRMRWEAPFALVLWGLAGVVAREAWLWFADDALSDPVLIGAVIRWYCAIMALVTFARWFQRRRHLWAEQANPPLAPSQATATPLLPSSPSSEPDVL